MWGCVVKNCIVGLCGMALYGVSCMGSKGNPGTGATLRYNRIYFCYPRKRALAASLYVTRTPSIPNP